MIIGYVRVSTVEQNEGRQLETMNKYKVEKIFQEKISAKDTNRPELMNMLEFAREGDTIVIHDFSRLARSTKDLLDIVELIQGKGVNLISTKENIDTSTPTGKLMLTMIGAINEFERANLLERQREGIALAKKEGKYKGRKKIDYPNGWEEVYYKWKNRELKGNEAMEQLGLKRTTFYKLISEYEGEKPSKLISNTDTEEKPKELNEYSLEDLKEIVKLRKRVLGDSKDKNSILYKNYIEAKTRLQELEKLNK